MLTYSHLITYSTQNAYFCKYHDKHPIIIKKQTDYIFSRAIYRCRRAGPGPKRRPHGALPASAACGRSASSVRMASPSPTRGLAPATAAAARCSASRQRCRCCGSGRRRHGPWRARPPPHHITSHGIAWTKQKQALWSLYQTKKAPFINNSRPISTQNAKSQNYVANATKIPFIVIQQGPIYKMSYDNLTIIL